MSKSTLITDPEMIPAHQSIRLQKFLSEAGICSRRKGERYIRAGRVSVNGRQIIEPGTCIDPHTDRVTFDGKPVCRNQKRIYIALNKPEGFESTCRRNHQKIVLDLVNINERVYPVGRLDKDSKGLLLLTNDGRLHHVLSHPSFDHEKEYEVVVENTISNNMLRKMERGISLDGVMTRPCRIKRFSERRFRIILQEGRNRQIRRMVQSLGNRVVTLKRLRMANIRLGHLAEGRWRYLSEHEKKILLKHL
jgi:23S rRNA pseudouridine2605 synthase/23S rRNA pseudouridine2604 synthase